MEAEASTGTRQRVGLEKESKVVIVLMTVA
jgi:hypothetical protein